MKPNYQTFYNVRPMEKEWGTFSGRLAWARKKAHLSQSALAGMVGIKQPTISYHGKHGKGSKHITAIARVLHVDAEWLATGRGYPEETHEMESATKKPSKMPVSEAETSFVEDQVEVRFLDLRPAAGPDGAMLDVMTDRLEEVTIGRYVFPARGFREQFGAEPKAVVIVEVKGDSMIPTLLPGQRVMVDTSDQVPSPAGIFLVWDGLSQVVKRVEYLAHSEPPAVRIISDNQRYAPYERQLGEAYIQGRVVGSWGRM